MLDNDGTDSTTRAVKHAWVPLAMSHRDKQYMSPLPKTPVLVEPIWY
jgi:hypothetical protein